MKIVDQAAYDAHLAKQTDPYSAEVFAFATRWADGIEAELAQGNLLHKVHRACASAADKSGITGSMYYLAVGVLRQHWAYGAELAAVV